MKTVGEYGLIKKVYRLTLVQLGYHQQLGFIRRIPIKYRAMVIIQITVLTSLLQVVAVVRELPTQLAVLVMVREHVQVATADEDIMLILVCTRVLVPGHGRTVLHVMAMDDALIVTEREDTDKRV